MSDRYLAQIRDEIGRAFDPDYSHLGRSRVDYHDLSIQHLGSIYEGLLELQPHHAAETMVVLNWWVQGRTEEKVQPLNKALESGFNLTAIRYPPGSVYLLTDKGERRATGSYYTPDHIVDYIVENTLGPLCNLVSEQLTDEILATEKSFATATEDLDQLASQLAQLTSDFDDRLKIARARSGDGFGSLLAPCLPVLSRGDCNESLHAR